MCFTFVSFSLRTIFTSCTLGALGLVVSVSASVLVGRGFSAEFYQDLVNWYCSLLTRRTVFRRATGIAIGLERGGLRLASLPKKRYSKWTKHCTQLTGAAFIKVVPLRPGLAQADARPNEKARCGAPLRCGLMQDLGVGPTAKPMRGAPLRSDLSIKSKEWDMVESRYIVLALDLSTFDNIR